MAKIKDLTGKRFGRWEVISVSETKNKGIIYWECVCSCGEHRDVRGASLISGDSTSCGCARIDAITIHGKTKTREFKSWDSMKQRCTNPNSLDYQKYGERGIKVCDRWLNSFDNFFSDMGERPEGRSLDRIDNEGNYEPENCRWATPAEQLANRRNTVKVLFDGTLRTVKELSKISGLKEKIIRDRLYAKWPIDKIMTTPSRKQNLHEELKYGFSYH